MANSRSPLVWAEAGLVLTGTLLAGDQDVRPHAPALIAEAVGALPDGVPSPRLRADSGLFSADVAYAAVAAGADSAVAAVRKPRGAGGDRVDPVDRVAQGEKDARRAGHRRSTTPPRAGRPAPG